MDPGFPEHSVTLRHAEVMEAAVAARGGRRAASLLFTLALLLALMLAIAGGHMAAFMLAQVLPFEAMMIFAPYGSTVVPALFALVALKIVLDAESRLAGKAYLAKMRALGIPLERAATYRVLNEGLQLATERVDLLVRWPAIDSVEKGRLGWAISGDQLTMLLPYASFASEEEQRAFLAAIVGRMDQAHRNRSRDAVDFAEKAKAAPVLPMEALPLHPAPASSEHPDPSGPVVEGRGWLTQQQASWAAAIMYARLSHHRFHQVAYPLLATGVGFLLGLLLTTLAGTFLGLGLQPWHPAVYVTVAFGIPLLGACLGFVFGQRRLAIVLAKAWRQELDRRGVPDQVEATYALGEDGIVYRTDRFTGEAAYASIHQVLRIAPYWIVAADSLTLCISDDCFADAGQARAFIAALLARIEEPARERSDRVA
ncbi:hypothetical protein [Tsuneonella sp. HG222]